MTGKIAFFVFAGTLTAVAGTVEVGTLRADTAQIGEITPLPPERGLVLYLPFETNQGGGVTDASGNGYNGIASNCVWTSIGRYAGGAMYFNGANSSVVLSTVPNFLVWDTYSVSVWFNHSSPDVTRLIMDKSDPWNPSGSREWYICSSYYGNGIQWIVHENTYGYCILDGWKNYADGQWHHVVAVRDGFIAQLWIDGILWDSKSLMPSSNISAKLCVGNSLASPYYGWLGLIDEVRIYDRPLSPMEIGQLYTDGLLALAAPVMVTDDLAVDGDLTVMGAVNFEGGARYLQPSGDLPQGSFTNAP